MPVTQSANGYYWWTCEYCGVVAQYPAEKQGQANNGLSRHLSILCKNSKQLKSEER